MVGLVGPAGGRYDDVVPDGSVLAWWMWDWRDGIRLGIWYEIAGVWACESGDDGSARRGTGTVLDGGMSGGVGCGWGG